MMKHRHKSVVTQGQGAGGFTLIELMVTIAVLGLLLSIAVPSFEQVMADSRRTSDVNELLLSLNLARSEALKRGSHVTICKSSNGTSCAGAATPWSKGWIVFVNNGSANVDTVDAGEEILLAKSELSKNIVVTPNAAVTNFARFRPDGRVDGAAAFTVCDDRGIAHARGVFISATGRPTSSHEHPDGTALSCP